MCCWFSELKKQHHCIQTGKLATAEQREEDLKSSDWVTVRYKYNRGTLHDGNYPHQSTPVRYIKTGYKRVILGFNAFTEEMGECCMRAPEHSDAFNRTIKLYQTMAALGVPITANNLSNPASGGSSKYGSNNNTSDASLNVLQENIFIGKAGGNSDADTVGGTIAPVDTKKGMNVKDIMKNPALAKLLVTAAKKLAAHDKKKAEEDTLRKEQQQS